MKTNENNRPVGPNHQTKPERSNSWRLFWLTPLMTTPLLYWFFNTVSASFLSLSLRGNGWRTDLLLHVGVAYFILAFSRRFPLFLVNQALIMGTLYLGSSVKIAYWGWPLRPEDLMAIPELVRIVALPAKIMILGPGIILLISLVANFRFRPIAAVVSVTGAASAILWVSFAPAQVLDLLDRNIEHTIWNQTRNLRNRGAGLYLVTEYCRTSLTRPTAPSEQEISAAVSSLRHKPVTPTDFTGRRRSLYLIVLESFWDASQLESAEFDRNPLHPDFLALWDQADNSVALSGEFGGATANPEFEILCGIPSQGVFPAVVFKNSLTNDIACLPRLLSQAGWSATAFHANTPDFWNRRTAYEHIGFSTYISKSDFRLEDLNGRFLSDESFYSQSEQWMDTNARSTPRFAYVLTISNHWPYALGDRRPKIVNSKSSIPEVSAFANSLWYSSKELAEFISEIHHNEPDALIVALGDHLPNLGAKLKAYLESELVSTTRIPKMSPAGVLNLTSVPLLIIDGENGPLPVGTIAQYELPALILDLLGLKRPPWTNLFLPPDGLHVRTFGEVLLTVDDEGQTSTCRGQAQDPPECTDLNTWVDNIRTIAFDLTLGDQIVLNNKMADSD